MKEHSRLWKDGKLHQRGRSENNDQEDKDKVLFKLDALDDALKKAQNLLDNKPLNENYLYLKGRVLEKLDRLSEAEKWFKEALEINPKFSQAAFYLAAIENKRGNFEKSIDLYNYALSKDQIPLAGWKATTPFVSIDIGVACDNTITANISRGGKGPSVSNLKEINSVNIKDIKNNNIKLNQNRQTQQRNLKDKYESNPSGISTTMPAINKDEECRTIKNAKSLQQTAHKVKNNSVVNTFNYDEKLNNFEASPLNEKKKKRKQWRIGKSGKAKSKLTDSETTKSMSQEFYSVGNSINKTESISATSYITSSIDVKSKGCVKKTIKPKTKTNWVLNFSDRTLSSKLYSVKRKEIYLYENDKGFLKKHHEIISKWKNPKSVKKSTELKSRNKINKIETKVTKTNYKMKSYMKKPKIRAKVDLSESSVSLIKAYERTKRLEDKDVNQRDTSTKSWIQRPRDNILKNDYNFIIDNSSKLNKTDNECNDTMSIIYRHFNIKGRKNSSVNSSNTFDGHVAYKRNSETNKRIGKVLLIKI